MKHSLFIRFLIPIMFSALASYPASSQDSTNVFGFDHSSVKPVIQVFGNFEYNPTRDVSKDYSFWFGRAHLGLQYQFNKSWSAKIIIDRGKPTTVGQISVTDSAGNAFLVNNTSKEGAMNTMFLKFASLQWKVNDHLTLEGGAILQNHYITQEKFWGYRYLAETFQDRYYRIPSSDLGFITYVKPCEKFGFDVAVTNGEGFRFDQDAYGDVKIASGIDFLPVRNLQTRFYYDYTTPSKNPSKPSVQQLYSFFAGYKSGERFRAGGEFNYRKNHLQMTHHDLFGYSVFASCKTGKRMELFARFDHLQANVMEGDVHNWNYQNTGKAYITGIHYLAAEGVNVSLNYQGWQPDDAAIHFQHHVLLSFEYKL